MRSGDAWRADLGARDSCPACNRAGGLRPHVVWFGETPLEMGAIEAALRAADRFVAIGTSGAVYPAAGFVALARSLGASTCEINLEPSDNARLFRRAALRARERDRAGLGRGNPRGGAVTRGGDGPAAAPGSARRQAAILSAWPAPMRISNWSAFCSSCSVSLSSAAALGRLSCLAQATSAP